MTNPMPDESDTSKILAPLGQVWLDGKLVPSHLACVSVMDHGLLYGDGAFEGIRAYNGRIMKLATHLRRLFESAKAIRLVMPYTQEELAAAVRETLKANGRTDAYVRLCVTRGIGEMGINPFNSPRPTVFIVTCDLRLYPKDFYENGLPIISSSVMRNHPAALSPRIKSLNYLNNVLAKIEAIDAGVFEAVMYNHQGFVAECTADNLFIVKGGRVITPPLSAGSLEGCTRNLVMDLAREAGLPMVEQDLTRHDLYVADEMFLTGTGAEVIPVTLIDKRPIGTGKPGPVTRQLIGAFRALIAKGVPEN